MRLKELAHVRTGDKGNTCNIAVIAYKTSDYPLLKEKLTADTVKNFYADFCKGTVTRYEANAVCGLNFVLEQALDGGVTRSLAMDRHGKTLGMALLELEIG